MAINTVYDIGAHKGSWTEQHAALFPNGSFYLFEAKIEHADLAPHGVPAAVEGFGAPRLPDEEHVPHLEDGEEEEEDEGARDE